MPEGFHGRIEDLVGTFGAQEDNKDNEESDTSTVYDRKEITAIIAYSKVPTKLVSLGYIWAFLPLIQYRLSI